MSNADDDLKPLLVQLLGKMDVVLGEVSDVKATQNRMSDEFAEMKATQNRMSDEFAEVKATQNRMSDEFAEMKATQNRMSDKIDRMSDDIVEIKAEQKLQAGRVTRLEGKVDVMGSWLQSVDQRFVGLMAPINPPRKPAA